METNNRFTEGAQRALMIAQQSARQLGNNYVGTEHLLLGLALEGDGESAASRPCGQPAWTRTPSFPGSTGAA